jgi:hypothetical protein
MRVFRIAVLVGMMTIPVSAPVFAQFTPGFKLNEGKQLSEEEIARNKANEDAAREARSKIPNAKVSSDPWASVRPEPAAKAPKAKTSAK